MGHEDQLPIPKLSDRYRFSHGTFGRTRGNGRDAPISAVRGIRRPRSLRAGRRFRPMVPVGLSRRLSGPLVATVRTPFYIEK
jgi:hypothetical protein